MTDTPATSSVKQKIMLIEDDLFMIELLANELLRSGFEPFSFKLGKDAVQKFEEIKPNLILLDLLLPDQNGLETLRQIRRLPGGVETKVIVLSNIAEAIDQEEAKRLNVAEYLVKASFSLPEIIQHIQIVLAA